MENSKFEWKQTVVSGHPFTNKPLKIAITS